MKSRRISTNSKIVRTVLASGLFCLLLFLPPGCHAKTLAEYRAGLQSAARHAEELLDYVDEVSSGGEKDAAYERDLLSIIRISLPITEKIEWSGTSVETGNQWLEERLKTFEEETSDWENRRLILTEINERISALEMKLDELERPSASNRSKDEDKRRLAEIQRRPEYQKPAEQQESWFEKAQKKIRDWFREKFPQPEVPQNAPAGLQSLSVGLQILIYALVLGFIAFLIYRFAPFFADRFRRSKKADRSERLILGEKIAAHEDAQTLFDEAEAMARGGNLRGAIRKGYIAFLCELSDRRLIGLAQHKTNRDYLRDVRKKDALYRNMNGLTTRFERHWYGLETASESDWQEFKENYQKAVGETR
ncbi:MAG TPA: DUF4129 domain-containing protein [Pyrinomonadaceae bacterium]|jgi:hypothetical protein